MTAGRARGTARDAEGEADKGFRERFEEQLDFTLDGFQRRSMDAIDEGQSVLVSAPTGSGKTLVADYAAARALDAGGKAFYTTPIKALSNQKFAELAARYGENRVGLLTGDVSHQGWAPIVVMTTEVLRNMLFARSPLLDGLVVVVLDEVHYLQDPYRGSVWEEVLVLTPPGVVFVSLSATVANATDFGAWLRSIRGPTRVVVENRRPVVLHHHFAVAERGGEELTVLPLLRDGKANPTGAVLDDRVRRQRRHRYRAPRRSEVIEYLDEADMLPAITFIFSRAACDDATRQCLNDGIRLTTADERKRIRAADRGRRGTPRRRRPGHPGVRTMVGRSGGGDRPPPRRVGACFSPGGRAVLQRRSAQGGLCHRDAGPRDQHAGSDGGGGAVRQIPRLGHLGPDFGGVPAADRTGGTPGDRHGGPCLRPVDAGHALFVGGRAPRSPRPRIWCPPSIRPTTWPSIWCGAGPARRPTGCWVPPTASGRRRRGRSRWPPSSTADWPSWRSGASWTGGG